MARLDFLITSGKIPTEPSIAVRSQSNAYRSVGEGYRIDFDDLKAVNQEAEWKIQISTRKYERRKCSTVKPRFSERFRTTAKLHKNRNLFT